MVSKQYVSEKTLSAIRSDGQRRDIAVAVGVPFKDNRFKTWACPVKADGLFNGLSDLHGTDPSQAFRRSRAFLISLLHDFLDKGGSLYIFDGDKGMTKEEVAKFV